MKFYYYPDTEALSTTDNNTFKMAANPDRIAQMANSTAITKISRINSIVSVCIEKLDATNELAKKLAVRAQITIDPRLAIVKEIGKATGDLESIGLQFKGYEEHPSVFEERRTSAGQAISGSFRKVVRIDDIQEAIALFKDSEDASKESWDEQIALIEKMNEQLKVVEDELRQLEELTASLL